MGPTLLLLSLPALAMPHSHDKLVSANGHGVVVVDANAASGAVLTDFRDHLYQQASASQEPGRDLLYDGYFGLGDGSTGDWLTTAGALGYDNGTGLIHIDRSTADLQLTEWVFTPRGLDLPAYVQLLHVVNTSDTTRVPRLFSLHNHQVGTDYTGAEAIWVDTGSSVLLGEWGVKTGLGMVVRPLVSPSTWTCDRLWERMPTEGALDGRCGTAAVPWEHDDQVGGFQWDPGELAPGDDAWVGVVAGFFSDWNPGPATDAIDGWVAGRSPAELLAAESTAWGDWLASATVPADLTAAEQEVYKQALVFLAMGQVTESGDAFGQIPASLPVSSGGDSFSHLWNITWVRDSAYAIVALTAAGKHEEARAALAFLLQGKAGDYAHLVGRDYGLSVCRLYGDGSEWSDDDGTGPNVELDNFGLLLWALGRYTAATGDTTLLADRQDVVFDGIADVLVDVIDNDLVMADSSIWERHWNGHQQHFAYTQGQAVRGLSEAAELAALVGDGARAARYRDAAAQVRDGICAQLVDSNGVLAASREQLDAGEGYLDLAAVDLLNNGTLDAAGPVGTASLSAWDEGLRTPAGGYARNDDGDLYDEQEWIWADLRLADARRRACDEDGARELEDRVTALAVANHWTIPELLDPDAASFAGPAPMMGFGSGLYVLTLARRDEALADCADGVGQTCAETGGDSGVTVDGGASDGGSDIGAPVTAEGCGCGGSRPSGWLSLLTLPLLLRRKP